MLMLKYNAKLHKMSAPRVSPRKKKLSLNGKQEETNNKHFKTETANTENKEGEKNENFMKACLKLSHEAFLNIRKRFQVLYLPECKGDVCNHSCPVISTAAQQSVHIEVKSGNWCEALEVCLISILSGRSLSADVLKEIVEIIMNAHEDGNSGYTIDYILKKCQYTLLLNFSYYPPCSLEASKEFYRPFLTSPLDKKNKFTNRKQHNSDKGIVAYCFDRLMYELSMESKDDALVDRHNVSNDINDAVLKLHWRKENLELYEFLDRVERIKRLMLVLESVIDLLQTDLALWQMRTNSKTQNMRSKKPLISYVLWPDSYCQYGTVSVLCEQIMKVFAYIIHLQYPEEHIKIMSLWMNTVVQMFYLYGYPNLTDYPSPSIYCKKFANKLCDIISSLPPTSVLHILDQIQPSFMQHLVGDFYISCIFNIDKNNIILSAKICVEDGIWKNYAAGGTLTMLPKIYRNAKTTPCIFNTLSKTSTHSTTEQTIPESYPKLNLDLKVNKKVQKIYFVNILFITIFAYLETYSIKEFHWLLQSLNSNNNDEWDPDLQNSYKITNTFVKQYRSIIDSLKKLFGSLSNKTDEVSVILYELLTNYFS